MITDYTSPSPVTYLRSALATPHEFRGRWEVNGFGRAAKCGRGSGPTRTERLAARKAQRQARAKQRRRA